MMGSVARQTSFSNHGPVARQASFGNGSVARQTSFGNGSCAGGFDFGGQPYADSLDEERQGGVPLITNVAGVVPLTEAINVDKFGGALLIMSVCETEADGDPEENLSDERDHLGKPLDPGDLLVPGGRYRHWSRKEYANQASWGIGIMEQVLLDMGVSIDKISRLVIENGFKPDPVQLIHNFFESLEPHTPDALIYYAGPATTGGAWPLGWKTQSGLHTSAVLLPDDVACDRGPEGNRFVVADAPHTAAVWLKPNPRLLGLAAWDGDGIPGTGLGGPLLAQWLAGGLTKVPRGLTAWPLPPYAGLLRLPSFHKLFFGPALSPEAGITALWEVEAWFMSNPRLEVQKARGAELLARGGSQVLVNLLHAFAPSSSGSGGGVGSTSKLKSAKPKQTVNVSVILRLIRIFHALVVYSPVERWMGSMWEGLQIAMYIALNCSTSGGGSSVEPEESEAILAAVLNLMAACTACCPKCRSWCASECWAQVLELSFAAISPDDSGPSAPSHCAAVMSACRALSQIVREKTLDPKQESELQNRLLAMLLGSESEGVQVEAATTLLVACMRHAPFRRVTLEKLADSGNFLSILDAAGARVAAKLLVLLRTLAATPADPRAPSKSLGGTLLAGTSPPTRAKLDLKPKAKPKAPIAELFPSEVIDVVIHCLCRHSEDVEVQQWGLATLGTLISLDDALRDRAAEGGPACVLWALGSDHFLSVDAVSREALFCAHTLLQTPEGRDYFSAPATKLYGVAASAVARGLQRDPPDSEVAQWGLRSMEPLAAVRGGTKELEPFVGVITQAVLAPNAHTSTLIAGSALLSLLASSSQHIRDSLVKRRPEIVKSLQTRAREAANAENWSDSAVAAEAELQDWAKVILEVLGGLAPPPNEDPERVSRQRRSESPKATEKTKKADEDEQSDDEDQVETMKPRKSLRPEPVIKSL